MWLSSQLVLSKLLMCSFVRTKCGPVSQVSIEVKLFRPSNLHRLTQNYI